MLKKILLFCILLIFASAVLFIPSNYILDKMEHSKDTFALAEDMLDIVIIGDSIAKGTGDEDGNGFSTYLPEYLSEDTQRDISIYNAGIDGLKSEDLSALLKSGQLDSRLKESDMILLSIGGNDILNLLHANDNQKLNVLKDVQASYINNLKEILDIIKKVNPNSLIVFTGLYIPMEDASPLYTMLLNAWNSSTENIINEYSRAIFVETYDIFKTDFKKYISTDNLHPSSAGYRAISQRISERLQVYNNK